MASTPALDATDVSVRRGSLTVVRPLTMRIRPGSIVGLLGLNGAGKSSLLAALAGELPVSSGSLSVFGADLTRAPAWERCGAGLVLVPAGRQLFTELSVRDNLLIGGHLSSKHERAESLELVHELFPVLAERQSQRAGALSGGQQQMLAVGRGLMARPKVLMLDEPSEGLAPVIVDLVFDAIVRLRDEAGMTILLAEQNAGVVSILDELVLMVDGSITEARAVEASDRQEMAHYLFGTR